MEIESNFSANADNASVAELAEKDVGKKRKSKTQNPNDTHTPAAGK